MSSENGLEMNDGQMARQIVLRLGGRLLNERIPGEVYRLKEPGDSPEVSVPKVKILAVFHRIVDQSNGFQIPVTVNFKGQIASVIGYCLDRAFHGHGLSSQLSAINKAGLPVPAVTTGSGYLSFSNLDRTAGTHAEPSKGSLVINLCDELPTPERDVRLDDFCQ